MSLQHSANIIKSNLILNLDAKNKKSYNYTENLLLYSQNFTNGWWNGGTVTRTDNTLDIKDPFGRNNASKIQATNQSFGGLLRTWSSPIVAGTQYTLSVYAKAGNYRYLGLGPQLVSSYSDPLGGDRYVVYDLYSGKVTNNITVVNGGATISSCGIIDVGNGWYRCWVTGTPGGANGITDISITQSNGGNNYTPAGTEYIYIYGAQLQKGVLGDYVQTISSQANTNLNWYDLSGNSNNFTLAGTSGYGTGAVPSYNNSGYLQFTGNGEYAYNTSRNWIPNSFTISIFAKDFSAGMLASSLMWFGTDHDGWRLKTVGAETYHNSSPEYYNTWTYTQSDWNMFTYVHSPTYAKNYINITETSSISAASGTYDWLNTYNRMEIGRYTLQDWNTGGYLNGKVATVLAYDKVLSASEITQNFNALRGRYSI